MKLTDFLKQVLLSVAIVNEGVSLSVGHFIIFHETFFSL